MRRQLFFIRLALINTFKKRLRAILAIGVIALTSAVVVVLFGVDIGLHNLVQNEINQSDSKDVVTVTLRNTQQVKLDDTAVSRIKSISGVGQVVQFVGIFGTAVLNDVNLNMPLYAVSPEYFMLGSTISIAGNIDKQPSDNNAIVSKKVLEIYGISLDKAVGQKIKIQATLTSDTTDTTASTGTKETPIQEYTIAGVIDRGDLPLAYIPIDNVKKLGLTSVNQLKVRLTDVNQVGEVREAIEQQGFQTTSILDTIGQVDKLFTVIRNVLVIFGIIVFVVTISATFTIISLTLMEETQQVGFLRINGLLKRDVNLLFLIQSIVLTLLGAIGGSILGTLFGSLLNMFSRSVASGEAFSSDVTIFEAPINAIVIIIILSVVTGWLVSQIPIRRAVSISPLQELKE